jgi:hypothetical protein
MKNSKLLKEKDFVHDNLEINHITMEDISLLKPLNKKTKAYSHFLISLNQIIYCICSKQTSRDLSIPRIQSIQRILNDEKT